MPGSRELPGTLARSPKKAQRTWIKAHDAAVAEYGEGERAHRTAFAAVKRGFEKVGDRWEPKSHKGPSDPGPTRRSPRRGRTAGGVNATATKAHLYSVARRLDVPGRSTMTKDELVDAIDRANQSRTRAAGRYSAGF
ncbi:ChaB family protein [Actinosynnema sp. NPDC023587]|uniref:ChaB family protein n=1 Tax=Actinosynnema sp. NPDC023587 TaxID=3154695 RepID=UPI0033F475BD